MGRRERLRLLLDANISSRGLVRLLTEGDLDVVGAEFEENLRQLDDPVLFAFAQQERRILVTQNVRDFPDILRDWADAGRRHHGCILSAIPTNAYGEMKRRFDRLFELHPSPDDWIDLAVFL